MKEIILKPLILILFVSISLQSCDRTDDVLNPAIEVQDFVWKGLNAYYLYQEDIADLSDTRFSSDLQLENYLVGFDTPVDIFNSLKLPSDSRSLLIDDYTIEDIVSPLRSSFTTGMEFGLFKDPNRLDSIIGFVSHILPLSQASTDSIVRGDFFYAIINEEADTIHLKEDNYRALLLNYPQDTLKLLMANFNGDTLIINNQRVDLVKKNYQYPPILLKEVFDLGAKKVGYLLYNNDFSTNYIGDLNATMQEFKNESVNELIIDLRYAIGSYSYARTIAEIASMITGQFPNEILMKETWNEKAQTWFELNQPDSLITKFPSKLQNNETINSLNLTENNSNFNHTYSLQPTVVTFSNKEDETYETGIIPTIQLCTVEDALNLGELGKITDPLLGEVLQYITTGNTGVTFSCNPFELELIYVSIDSQRLIDKGTFIKQDLPNLGR